MLHPGSLRVLQVDNPGIELAELPHYVGQQPPILFIEKPATENATPQYSIDSDEYDDPDLSFLEITVTHPNNETVVIEFPNNPTGLVNQLLIEMGSNELPQNKGEFSSSQGDNDAPPTTTIRWNDTTPTARYRIGFYKVLEEISGNECGWMDDSATNVEAVITWARRQIECKKVQAQLTGGGILFIGLGGARELGDGLNTRVLKPGERDVLGNTMSSAA